MNAQAKPNEPSMEEILASIRRIISDDEAKPAEAAAEVVTSAPEPEPTSLDDDVLDLGTEASFVAPPAEPASSTPTELDADVDFREAEEAEPPAPAAAVIPEEPPAPAAAPRSEPAPQPVDMASLLSDQASSAVTSAFGQLANTVLNNNARTLEDLVKDMLKPMLKTWLDDNLPSMVERLVRAEIERVARGGRS